MFMAEWGIVSTAPGEVVLEDGFEITLLFFHALSLLYSYKSILINIDLEIRFCEFYLREVLEHGRISMCAKD